MTTQTTETNEVVANEVAAVEVKPKAKRTRTAPKPKETKTGLQIMANINRLQTELEKLEGEVEEVNPSSTLFPMVKQILDAKRAELDAAMNAIFTV